MLKKIFILTLLISSIQSSFAQKLDLNCVNLEGEYKVKRAFIWVDTIKIEVNFTIDFSLQNKGILLKLYVPGNSSEIFLQKDSLICCEKSKNGDFTAKFYSNISDKYDSKIIYNTNILVKKTDEKCVVDIETIGFENSRMILHLLKKKIKK